MKNNYAVLIVAVALVFFFRISPLWAGEEGNALSFEFKSKFQNSYIGCFGYKTDVGSIFVNEANISLPKSFYIYFWNFLSTSSSDINEIDGYLGWSGEFLGFKIDVAAGYWDLNNFFSSTGPKNDYWDVYIEVGREFLPTEKHKILSYIRVEYVEPVKLNVEDKGGIPVTLGLRHEWQAVKLFSLPILIKTDGRIVHDPGLFRGQATWLGRLTTQAAWKITNNFSIILPFVDFSLPFSNIKDKDGREFAAVVGIGINLFF
jgi:hypothetical protein